MRQRVNKVTDTLNLFRVNNKDTRTTVKGNCVKVKLWYKTYIHKARSKKRNKMHSFANILLGMFLSKGMRRHLEL